MVKSGDTPDRCGAKGTRRKRNDTGVCRMAKKQKAVREGLMILAAAGFLGFLYPELCMLEETCKVVYYDKDKKQQEAELPRGSELYYQLLQAKPEEIRIKSRLWETLLSCFEKDKGK